MAKLIDQRNDNYIIKKWTRESEQFTDIYAYLKGRMFDRWIDSVSGSARSNGHDEGDLIEIPSYIIESLIRDEVLAERDLKVTSTSAVNVAVCDELIGDTDSYYPYSIFTNVTTGHKTYVNGYVASTNTLAIQDNDASMAADDNFFLTNIGGDTKINYQSFDVLGNTTDGTRKDWKFAISIVNPMDVYTAINQILFESFCILFTSHDQYKIVTMDEKGTADATWTTPLYDKQNNKYFFNSVLTPISYVYNSYTLLYHYDYGSGSYRKKLSVDKNGYTSTLTNGATYQATCQSLFSQYKIINKYEYPSNWIYDDTTAEAFMDKVVPWFSKQRLMVSWATPIKNYIQYEIGDQVILNNSNLIPTGINNSSKFMITEKVINPLLGAPFIQFKLLEVT